MIRDGTTGRTLRGTAVQSIGGWRRATNRPQNVGVNVVAPSPNAAVEVAEPDLDEFTDESTDTDRPWVVIVWNDPINLMSYVSFVFQKLFGYAKEKADALMLDVHEKGRAVVSSGPRERAEIDVFRLHEHGLWATMQQDDA